MKNRGELQIQLIILCRFITWFQMLINIHIYIYIYMYIYISIFLVIVTSYNILITVIRDVPIKIFLAPNQILDIG